MYNSDIPSRAELPSPRRLIRSTLLALLTAIAILITIVLPAEYGIDPTGIGRFLGLAEMGEIKVQLAEEAEADRQRHLEGADRTSDPSRLIDRLVGFFVAGAYAHSEENHQERSAGDADTRTASEDEIAVTLAPGEYVEVKLTMSESAVATFAWEVEGGLINYDLHGHGDGGESISYDKGRGVSGRSGTLTAAFSGEHGWFWRNRDKQDLTLKFQVQGEYAGFQQRSSADD